MEEDVDRGITIVDIYGLVIEFHKIYLFEFFYQVGYQFLKTLNNLRTDLDFKC
jgi:hypothetical protein